MPSALGPADLRLWMYISDKSLMPSYIETFRDDKGTIFLQSMRVAHPPVILN